MTISSSNPNQAKEVGGNLDAQLAVLKSIEQLVLVNQKLLAVMKVVALQLGTLTGNPIDPDTLLE